MLITIDEGVHCRPLPRRILVISGIWPPDVGGPATHAPELARFLVERGHDVRAVTTGAQRPQPSSFPLTSLPRDVSRPRRMVEGAAVLARQAAHADVLYATGLYSRSAFASRLTGTPLVIKVVEDPAYERARALGLFEGTLEEFQAAPGSAPVRALKLLRRAALAQATRIVVTSRYFAGFTKGWGVASSKLEVIPNPMPFESDGEPRESLRSRLGIRGPTFVFAGRFVRQKNLPLAIEAIGLVPQANLVLVGDGPELARLHDAAARTRVLERVRFEGATTRSTVLDWFRAADAALLPSDWETVPHGILEALSVGTPVIGTAVGGVPEVVQPQVNGLLVPAGDVRAFAAAVESLADDEDLRARLSDGANATISRYRPENIFGAIEGVLEQAAGA